MYNEYLFPIKFRFPTVSVTIFRRVGSVLAIVPENFAKLDQTNLNSGNFLEKYYCYIYMMFILYRINIS